MTVTDQQTVRCVLFGLSLGAGATILTAAGAMLGWTALDAVWPVFAATAVVGFAIHRTRLAVFDIIGNRSQTLRHRMERLSRTLGDVHGMVRLSPYTERLPLPFGGGWALTGDAAAILAREVIVRRPSTIVELGSGVSTLILAQILARRGEGHIFSVDHDRIWADETRANLEALDVAEVATVIHAPLTDIRMNDRHYSWYGLDRATLDRIGEIDCLVVDGPPRTASQNGMSRYPALAVLEPQLSAEAFIFVDDTSRDDEARMVHEWANEGWVGRPCETLDGVTIMTRARVPKPA